MARRPKSWRTLIGALLALLVLAGACSGGDDASTEAGAGDASPSVLADALGRMPTEGGGFFVAGVSFDRLDAANSTSRRCGSAEETQRWFEASYITSDVVRPFAPQLLAQSPEVVGELPVEYGVTACDIHWMLESLLGSDPLVLAGDFDEPAIDAAVNADPVWSDLVHLDRSTDIPFYDWGDELDFERITPLRRLGVGGQLVRFGPDEGDSGSSVVAITGRRESMLDVIEAEGRSVADNVDVQVALPMLLAAEPVSLLLTNEVPTVDSGALAIDDIENLRDDVAGPEWLLERYRLLAAAQRVDADGELLEVVLVHGNATTAENNLALVEQMIDDGESIAGGGAWSDRLVLESAGTRDTVLIVQLRSTDPERSPFRLLLDSIFRRDTLFASG